VGFKQNTMKNYLTLINEKLTNRLAGNVKTYEELDSLFIMKEKALEEDIKKCNAYFKNMLPNDYIMFLRNFNGGVLFQIEDFAGFKFYGTDELIHENLFQRKNFGKDWDDNIILFCLCIGDGECIGFQLKNGGYEVIHCILDEIPSSWQTIDASFDDFIGKLIVEKGKKYWLES
jgi:hypothetical protein